MIENSDTSFETTLKQILDIKPEDIKPTTFRKISITLGRKLEDLGQVSHPQITQDRLIEFKEKIDTLFKAIVEAEEGAKKNGKVNFFDRLSDRLDRVVNFRADTINGLVNKANVFSRKAIAQIVLQETAVTPVLPDKAIFRKKESTVRKFLVHNPRVNDVGKKWKTVIEKAGLIGKGSFFKGKAVPGAQLLDESYWIETLTFKVKGRNKKRVRAYQNDLAPHFQSWKSAKNSEGIVFSEVMNFKNYLQDVVKLDPKVTNSKIQYLHSEKRGDYQVTFEDKKMLQKDKPVADGLYMFVLDPKGTNLYLGKKQKGIFHHSSFLAGGAVSSAGMADVKDGQITKLYMHSGHYKPGPEQMEKLQNFLADESRLGEKAESIKIEKSNPSSALERFSYWVKVKFKRGH